jgi:hypothetical protein
MNATKDALDDVDVMLSAIELHAVNRAQVMPEERCEFI